MTPKIVCITGPDGAGKTTQVNRLAAHFAKTISKASGGSAAPGGKAAAAVTIWDLLLDPKCKGKLLFSGPSDVDRYLSILHPTSRALFLYHCFYEALAMAEERGAAVLIANSYWYKYYATEIAHGGDPKLLRDLTLAFPEPDLTFYLRLTPSLAFARKDVLSGYESGFTEPRTEEAFLSFQETSLRVLDGLAEELSWIPLDGTQSVGALTEAIVERVDQEGWQDG